MSQRTMTAQDFEARYAQDADPWRYRDSRYEHDKYRATLAACGRGPFGRALELGGSIGVFTALLAPRCASLVTIDASATAVRAARREVARLPQVDVRQAVLPDGLPAGRFELVVASEILYYLTAGELDRTIAGLRERLVPGGRLVAVHWRPRTAERPQDAREVHGALAATPRLRRTMRRLRPDYLLEAYACA